MWNSVCILYDHWCCLEHIICVYFRKSYTSCRHIINTCWIKVECVFWVAVDAGCVLYSKCVKAAAWTCCLSDQISTRLHVLYLWYEIPDPSVTPEINRAHYCFCPHSSPAWTYALFETRQNNNQLAHSIHYVDAFV